MYDNPVFERLGQAIEELEVLADADSLAEGFALLDRLAAKLSVAMGEFDASCAWELEGATSAAAWLRARAGMTSSTAHATVRAAKLVRSLPVTRQAWLAGSLSGGQVTAITANVSERAAALFAEQEEEVVPWLVGLNTHQTGCAMRHWRVRAEAVLGDVEPREPERSVYLSRTFEGRFVLNGSFDVEGGEVLDAALRLAAVRDFERMPARVRGDALVDIARFFLDHQHHVPAGRHRPHLNVVVDYEALVEGGHGRVVGGGYLDGASIRRLLCDAGVNRVVVDGSSTILDYGTTTRTVPTNLWNALVLRDGHCRHHGCDRPPQFCEAHHVVSVLEGGPTCLDNLVLKCTRHHHIGHLPGWSEKLRPDGTFVTTDPQGRTRTTHPHGLRSSLVAA
jgi:uncharacterized protein DUF222